MLMDWLKKDLAKDVAAVKAFGNGLTSGGRTNSTRRAFGPLASAAAGLVGVATEVLCASASVDDVHRPVEVLDTRNPVTRDWFATERFGIRDF